MLGFSLHLAMPLLLLHRAGAHTLDARLGGRFRRRVVVSGVAEQLELEPKINDQIAEDHLVAMA